MELKLTVTIKKCCEKIWAAGFADIVENHDLSILVDMVKVAAAGIHGVEIRIIEDDIYNPQNTLGHLLDGSFGQKIPEERPILGVVDLVPLPENVIPTKCSKCGNDFTPEDKLLVAIFGKDLQKALCMSCNEQDEEEPSVTVNGEPLSEFLNKENTVIMTEDEHAAYSDSQEHGKLQSHENRSE